MRRSISKTDNILYVKFSAMSVLAVMMMMTIMSALAVALSPTLDPASVHLLETAVTSRDRR